LYSILSIISIDFIQLFFAMDKALF